MSFDEYIIVNDEFMVNATDIDKENNLGVKPHIYRDRNKVKLNDIRFVTLNNEDEYEKHIRKLKILDAYKIRDLGNGVSAIEYGNKNLDIISNGKVFMLDRSDKNWLPGKPNSTFKILDCNFLDLSGVKIVARFTNSTLFGIFLESKIKHIDLGKADLTTVNSLYMLFYKSSSLKSIDFSNIIPPKECSMDSTFAFVVDENAEFFYNLDLTAFDNTRVTVTEDMFLINQSIKEKYPKRMIDALRSIKTNNNAIKYEIYNNIRELEEYADRLHKF